MITNKLRHILPNKYDIGGLLILFIIALSTVYFLNAYIFPNFLNKLNPNFVKRFFIIVSALLFLLVIVLSLCYGKYQISDDEEAKNRNASKKFFEITLAIFKVWLLPIVIGLMMQLSGKSVNSIKENDIIVFDSDRSSGGIVPNISVSPIKIKLSWLGRSKLKLCVFNNSKKTLKNGILFINLPKGCRIISGETWGSVSDRAIFTNLVDINPNTNLILRPLELEFTELKAYELMYSVSGEDFRMPQQKMLIEVMQK